MPHYEIIGHFAVVSSKASKSGWKDSKGYQVMRKRVGLLEIDPSLVQTKLDEYGDVIHHLHIDCRCKGVKKILFKSDSFNVLNNQGWHMHRRLWCKLNDMAKELEHLWPCHMLSRHYPRD